MILARSMTDKAAVKWACDKTWTGLIKHGLIKHGVSQQTLRTAVYS